MQPIKHKKALRLPNISHLSLYILAFAAMFASAYLVFRWMDAISCISGWTGLTTYEADIPKLQMEATIWAWLAITLPFIAALLLWLRARYSVNLNESRRCTSEIKRYLGDLGISVLGTIGFCLCLFLVGFFFQKLRR